MFRPKRRQALRGKEIPPWAVVVVNIVDDEWWFMNNDGITEIPRSVTILNVSDLSYLPGLGDLTDENRTFLQTLNVGKWTVCKVGHLG